MDVEEEEEANEDEEAADELGGISFSKSDKQAFLTWYVSKAWVEDVHATERYPSARRRRRGAACDCPYGLRARAVGEVLAQPGRGGIQMVWERGREAHNLYGPIVSTPFRRCSAWRPHCLAGAPVRPCPVLARRVARRGARARR